VCGGRRREFTAEARRRGEERRGDTTRGACTEFGSIAVHRPRAAEKAESITASRRGGSLDSWSLGRGPRAGREFPAERLPEGHARGWCRMLRISLVPRRRRTPLPLRDGADPSIRGVLSGGRAQAGSSPRRSGDTGRNGALPLRLAVRLRGEAARTSAFSAARSRTTVRGFTPCASSIPDSSALPFSASPRLRGDIHLAPLEHASPRLRRID